MFTYTISKNNTVFTGFHGKEIKIVKGKEAQKLIGRIQQADTAKEVQLELANHGKLRAWEQKKQVDRIRAQLLKSKVVVPFFN